MFSKKSQAHTQIFIYILSIVLVGLILLYGYRAIAHFGKKTEQVSYIKFKTDLESIVRSIGPDYGTVKRQEFVVGKDYKAICFVDSGKISTTYSISAELSSIHPVIWDMVVSGVNKNTFLMTDSVEESFDVGKIEVDNGTHNFICVQAIKGRVRIEFEGKGDRTKIREWPLS